MNQVRPLHDLVAEQARARPDAVAIDDLGQWVTYGELDAWSSALAGRIAATNQGPEAPVGLLLERGAPAVAAALGALRAGCAYVPLDPTWPRKRLTSVAENAGIRTTFATGPTEFAHTIAPEWSGGTASFESPPVSIDGIAYVTYTSGSTGTPKGVAVPHRGVSRLAKETPYADVAPGDRVAHLSSLTFDASALELWTALVNGACVTVVSASAVTPEMLAEELRRREVTIAWLVASVFHAVAERHLDKLTGLRRLIVGGERIGGGAARAALEALPGCELVNGYGPTEATIFSAHHRIEADSIQADGVPVGRAIPGWRLEILDDAGRPCSNGEEGELHIAGEGVARGYLGNPTLTAERFVPDPAGGGGRLYRTGDLARALDDGNIVVLGRCDRQVKVRGYRIELDEVEHALRELPQVSAAAATVCRAGTGERRLVGYLSGESDLDGIRAAAMEWLPSYMLPARLVWMPTLPLNAHGKIDRGRLPNPFAASVSREAAEPADERSFTEAWRRVLGVDDVDATDNLFDLGGTSLTVEVLQEELSALLGRHVPATWIFEFPTPRRFGRFVAEEIE